MTEIGEIISHNPQNKDWQVKYRDDTIVDIDADTLEHTSPDHENKNMDDGIREITEIWRYMKPHILAI